MILQYIFNTGIQYFVWVLQHTLDCESMNFHPEKQLFQVAAARDRTTDPWITKRVIYLYTMGDPLRQTVTIQKME